MRLPCCTAGVTACWRLKASIRAQRTVPCRVFTRVSPVLVILLLVGMGGALYAFYRIFLILF